MTATLRVVLDQLVARTDADLAAASRDLARAVIAATPRGAEVAAIVPSVGIDDLAELDGVLPGLADVRKAPLARRELAAAWQVGLASGVGGGMIHSPSLMAPLVRHDRVHDHDQTVVTLWDLRPWETPELLPRSSVAWQKAMLKRAVKFADAVVVPTHAMADRLREVKKFGDRVRVIAGAAPTGFVRPLDDVGRRRALDLPHDYVVVVGGAGSSEDLTRGLTAIAGCGVDIPVVVLGILDGEEPAIVEAASAAGIPERRMHVRGVLDEPDRAALLSGAAALVAPSESMAFPWRVIEALALGTPVVAARSGVHSDVIADGGVLVEGGSEALSDALAVALGSETDRDRLRVLSADRGRAFSWADAASRVWQLHADL